MPADPGAALRLDPGRGLVFVARSTALNAAQSGGQRAAAVPGAAGAGVDGPSRFLKAAGGWLVGWTGPGLTCETTADRGDLHGAAAGPCR